ncbi:ubiquitin-conjugating enzyme E2 Z [Hyalella azteca]|uniref:Ubiquitin-conjugating enzyme E2 Z n=1 Tax=Hyalella azteca TaxID=294128 RepID=A0A8B7NWB9_HYAAZ|nr:ubiquitin-conjugating enzyme E2 Z [Hyalella azteca]
MASFRKTGSISLARELAIDDPVLRSHISLGVASCPFNSKDWDIAPNSATALKRAERDVAMGMSSPTEGIFVSGDDANIMFVHAMIVGSFDTPYEGGFFQFMVRFGPNYPFDPPRVCCMSSYRYGHVVRFNPNFYEDGTVCLSILGTWEGPSWAATNTLSSLLLSIQSMLSAEALCNEPGYERLRGCNASSVTNFDIYARHETLRVAVVETLRHAEGFRIPAQLVEVMRNLFFEYYDAYIESCDQYAMYDNKTMQVSLLSKNFVPNFKEIKKNLTALHSELQAKL